MKTTQRYTPEPMIFARPKPASAIFSFPEKCLASPPDIKSLSCARLTTRLKVSIKILCRTHAAE